MSKKPFKAQASSSRAFSGGFDGFNGPNSTGGFGGTPPSQLSHVYEPPALSSLRDAQVAVAFKNVQKKDSTTKSKALEDLQSYVRDQTGNDSALEDEFLDAWTKVYPRTSIDNSRRVRLLAHTLQGQIASACGKRIAKHLPQSVPSWLSGIYDVDKAICRATQESFRTVFPTEEKYRTIWKVYQADIIAFVRNVVETESPQTLSDERVTSPDDANTKYDRTLGATLQMANFLIDDFSSDDLLKSAVDIDSLVGSKEIWKLASASDSFVRRSLYKLLSTTLQKRKGSLIASTLSTALLARGLSADQTGSILDYVKIVAALSDNLPTVWTDDYHGEGKKSAHHRLCQFLRKGSQNGPADTWTFIRTILANVPDVVLIKQADMASHNVVANETDAHEILDALHSGVRGEGFANSDIAWQVYLGMCSRICGLAKDENLKTLLEQHVYPMVETFVRPAASRSWLLSGSNAAQHCSQAWSLMFRKDEALFRIKWQALSAQVIEDINVSLPEQSKDYTKSQDSVIKEASRWYSLYSPLLQDYISTPLESLLSQCLRSEVNSVMSLLKNRNGKPYGAASALLSAINALVLFRDRDPNLIKELDAFAEHEIPRLVLSPSAPYLVHCLDSLSSARDIGTALEASLSRLEEASDSQIRTATLKAFFSSKLAQSSARIRELAERLLRRELSGKKANVEWDLADSILASSSLSEIATDDILSQMTERLHIDTSQESALDGFEHLAEVHSGRLRGFASSDQGTTLLTNLLLLGESTDPELSSRARGISASLEGTTSAGVSSSKITNSSVALIQASFKRADRFSLSVESLARQAELALTQLPATSNPESFNNLLPDLRQWAVALRPHLAETPAPSLAACSSFGAAFHLVRVRPNHADVVSRDTDGQALALRIARYLVIMCDNRDFAGRLTESRKLDHAQQLALLLELVGDDISARGLKPLLLSPDPDMENILVDFVGRGQHLLKSWVRGTSALDLSLKVQQGLLGGSVGTSSSSYYHARAYASVAKLLEDGQTREINTINSQFEKASTSDEPSTAFAVIAADPYIRDALSICNEVLSKVTGRHLPLESDRFVRLLTLIDVLLQDNPEALGEVPQPRIVFFMKHVVEELQNCPAALQIALLRVIRYTIEPIKDIYGSFWGELLKCIVQTLKLDTDDEEALGLLCVALQLCAHLQKLAMSDSNDDLVDAWTDHRSSILAGMFDLLLKMKDTPDHSHQPRRIINETLQRIIHRARGEVKFPIQELYAGLGAESLALQDATYDLLQEAIPNRQEDLSLEKGIDPSFTAVLPDELLSLIMAPPSSDDLAMADLNRSLPTLLRSYLLSWKVTLSHWDKASIALQSDYHKSLQEAGCISGFLNFATNILISSRHKAIDASRFSVDVYDPHNDDTPETDLNHLLIHIYYLIFLRLPSPAKTWWRDSTSRQTNIAVQSWTEKYVSPAIATVELSAVKDWAATTTATQSDSSSDPALTVKVSLTTREITASIPIDDRVTAISIRLPSAYPLSRAEVISVQRVGFAENKWQSWIRNAQGQLTISDGGSNALIDCLLAWKRNVTAAMKGQTECAICYSVVGSDKTLPKKECPTCKNRFHAGCLFRWFKSSNSSSCPLCRNTFAYS